MKARTNHSFAAIALLLGAPLLGCAEQATLAGPDPSAVAEVSAAALQTERAGRALDRGQDATEAKRLLREALESGALTTEERSRAVLELSRAHQVLGETEPAIATLEEELARRGFDSSSVSDQALRDRLRELLTGSSSDSGPHFGSDDPAPPFARFLSGFFPPDEQGHVQSRILIIGEHASVADELGTFDVRAGYRATLEEDCPLCEHRVNVSQSVSRSDWLIIPASRDEIDGSFVAVYFDLQKNRIPARYEFLLPMPIAAIEAELEAGTSFIAATDRGGAPPVILLAAPRTAMLPDVERALSNLDALPDGMLPLDVPLGLRRNEIRAELRRQYFASARGCYEALGARAPGAEGAITLTFVVGADGALTERAVTVREGDVDDAPFLDCLEAGLDALRFPATRSATTVNYPMAFSPG